MRQTEKTTLSLPCYSKSVTTPQPIGILCMFPSEPSLQTKHLQPNHAHRPSRGDAVTVLFTPTLTFHWVLRLCCLQLWVLCDQPLAQRLIWRYFSDAMLLHDYFHRRCLSRFDCQYAKEASRTHWGSGAAALSALNHSGPGAASITLPF